VSSANLQKKNPENKNLENEGAREWVPHFLYSDEEAPCPERQEHDGRSGVVHHLTGKMFPQEQDAKPVTLRS
jgi:hypothetical protein